MSHITTDESMNVQLGGITVPVEVRDPHGRLLGHYTPVSTAEGDALYEEAHRLFDYEAAKRVTDEDRAKARPLSEIIRRLEATRQNP